MGSGVGPLVELGPVVALRHSVGMGSMGTGEGVGDGGLGDHSREIFGSIAAAVVTEDPFDRGAIACEEVLGPAPKRQVGDRSSE
jgi:hypothetical protein